MKENKPEAQWKTKKRVRILENGFRLFAEKGIEGVTMPEIAKESGVGRATLYRYFNTKLDLVIAIGTQKWKEFISVYVSSISEDERENMTGAEFMRRYLDSFINMYHFHSDILCFNYYFNGYLRKENGDPSQYASYTKVAQNLGDIFHVMYERGVADGTLQTDISEAVMFSGSFHIMLAAVTRYAIGLIIIDENNDPEYELLMLKELLLSRFTKQK